VALSALVAAAVIAGCGSTSSSSSSTAASNSSAAASTSTVAANPCAISKLPLHTPGVLTAATDSPAYPPYFVNNKPANGKGYESAVAYAVAKQLGFSKSAVHWVVEHFDESYQPGPKNFDFDINEISITPQRAQVVDFSTPYLQDPQALIVEKGSQFAHVSSFAGLKNAKLGVQIGTTSLEAVEQFVKPSQTPDIFNNSNDVVSALKIGRVQGIVTDLQTAEYLVSSELPHTAIAAQFNAPNGNGWGMLMQKGSKLTPCVDKALAALQANGTLTALAKKWLPPVNPPFLH
jgi:polar amino acid transport system substrate-binding protein